MSDLVWRSQYTQGMAWNSKVNKNTKKTNEEREREVEELWNDKQAIKFINLFFFIPSHLFVAVPYEHIKKKQKNIYIHCNVHGMRMIVVDGVYFCLFQQF